MFTLPLIMMIHWFRYKHNKNKTETAICSFNVLTNFTIICILLNQLLTLPAFLQVLATQLQIFTVLEDKEDKFETIFGSFNYPSNQNRCFSVFMFLKTEYFWGLLLLVRQN